ncbi:unnamed protein product [Ixodes pacificus]
MVGMLLPKPSLIRLAPRFSPSSLRMAFTTLAMSEYWMKAYEDADPCFLMHKHDAQHGTDCQPQCPLTIISPNWSKCLRSSEVVMSFSRFPMKRVRVALGWYSSSSASSGRNSLSSPSRPSCAVTSILQPKNSLSLDTSRAFSTSSGLPQQNTWRHTLRSVP